jgi:ankyrin repeat protein
MISFFDACRDGNLQRVKEIIRKDRHVLKSVDRAFRSACYYGHLEIAKWLFGVKPSINIRVYGDIAFRWACHGGHLKVAKWLLSVEPTIDVRAYDDDSFCLACFYGHFKVAKWLQRQFPNLGHTKTQAFRSRRVVQLISFFN